ncbi:MAG: radical SAM protein [Candidatus Thorarchaeota archaeon]|nr:radical SAM protein [Candidatus Thorarchaeota archaeon]
MTEPDSIIETCLSSPEEELGILFERAYRLSRERFSDVIAFHMPGMRHYETEFYSGTDPYRFPSISVSGSRCALDCEHCKGHLLESMIPARTPEQLWDACVEVSRRGGKGVLVSGGSTPQGNTPLARYLPVIKRVKEELDLDIVVHTGVVYPEVARGLGEARVDGAMLDVIGDRDTLRSVYHLDMEPDAFDRSMTLLEDNGVPIVPHIVVGLHYGKIRGEKNAIKMIARHRSESVVVVAFMPLDDTPMQSVTPSSPMDIARVLLACRLVMPERAVVLGCARPQGGHREATDRLAIDAGVSGIAYPTEDAHQYALQRGLRVMLSDECCSLLGKAIEIQ